MIKFSKLLMFLAIVVAILTVILVLYVYLKAPCLDLVNEEIDGHLRQELFDQYFIDSNLIKNVYSGDEQLVLDWNLNPELKLQDSKLLLKILNKNRDIFIAETEPIDFTDYDASKLNAPNQIGNYELWVYVIENDGQESLIQIIPFSVE